MAAVEVTISGVLYDKYARTTRPVVLIGEASLTGLGVGGGPIIPPGQPPDLGIWPNPPEGQAPLPSHPIALPGDPWWPSGGQPPANVVVVPKPPQGAPQAPSEPVAPSAETNYYGWHPAYGWGYFAPNQAVPRSSS